MSAGATGAKPLRALQIVGMATGLVLLIGAPVAAHFFRNQAVLRAMNALYSAGITDPEALAKAIHWPLNIALAGLLGTCLGLFILILAISSYVRAGRARSANQANRTEPPGVQ